MCVCVLGTWEFRAPDTCSGLVQAEAVTGETKKWAAWSVLSRQSPGCVFKVVIYEFEGLKNPHPQPCWCPFDWCFCCFCPVPLMKAESSPSDSGPVTLPCESGNWLSSGGWMGMTVQCFSLAGLDLIWQGWLCWPSPAPDICRPFPAVAVMLLSIQEPAGGRVGRGWGWLALSKPKPRQQLHSALF